MTDGEGGENRFGGSLLKICIVVVILLALVALCIYVSIPKSSPQTGTHPSPTSTSSTNSAHQEDSTTKDTTTSAQTQPSSKDILDFESAFNTTDPTERLELLKKVATAQYIEKEYSATSIDVSKLVVQVNRTTSTFSVEKDPQGAFCEVTTHVSLESFRNGKQVASYSAPQHTTVWVNTKTGWKVASEER